MYAIIDAAFSRTRIVTFSFILILILGVISYTSIPKESSPEVPIPVLYVVTTLEGISPKDSERLLVEPLEAELGNISGIKKMDGSAGEGYASVTLEFEAGFDLEEALEKVREAVDKAKHELPADADDPTVNEVNTALFPVLNIILSGAVPERTLNKIADDLKDKIEAVSGVLEVDVGGARTELMEVVIDPTVFETYNLSFDELIRQVSQNNRLVTAGGIESSAGRLVLKVPGLIENEQDVMAMPIKVRGNSIVTFGDVATVRRTYQDPDSFARINGKPALALEVKKRVGANIIETLEQVKTVIKEAEEEWPETIKINYLQDESQTVKSMLNDLEANVIAAIILVMIVVVWALGLRSALLVGLAIPGAFLAGVTGIWMLGYTMNIVVLFALILVVGMLVDGAIVTVELADRKLQEGFDAKQSYAYAAKRMAWPIIASTATTLSVFLPLLFWDAIIGQFMKYLPITVLLTLGASLFMALIFIPVLGGIIGKRQPQSAEDKQKLYAAEIGDPREIKGFTGAYIRILQFAILQPVATLLCAILLLLGGFAAYGQFGNGVNFFPSIEPDFMQVQVRAKDNFSIYERDRLVRVVENRLLNYDEIASVYARSSAGKGQDAAEVIGTIQLELLDWDKRITSDEIGVRIRKDMSNIAGIDVQVAAQEQGPPSGKPINLRVISSDDKAREKSVDMILESMERIGGFTDVTDSRPLPGVEWNIKVNRSEAARFGADVSLLGQAVQLLTQGIKISDYRPSDADGAIDIRLRFPAEDRTFQELQNLRVPTSSGLIPISNFVTFEAVPRSGQIKRIDQKRIYSVEANVAPGLLADTQTKALRAELKKLNLPENVEWKFAGEAQDQQDAMIFLGSAFVGAILMMFAILLIQFNSFYQSFVVMSAIIFSIGGVLIGLMITGRPFGVVMGGIGIISLAGIVVNNNIVLIDTYNNLKTLGMRPLEAALRTGAQRLRPVLLTSITTALGLMPMVIGLNINFYTREIIYGAPSTQWWTELSSAIAGGLVFATILTLLVTPAMLMLGEKRANRKVETPNNKPDANISPISNVPAE
jgi:multidrug efflux pump